MLQPQQHQQQQQQQQQQRQQLSMLGRRLASIVVLGTEFPCSSRICQRLPRGTGGMTAADSN